MTRRVPPDGGYGWFIVVGAVISQFLIFGYGRSFGVFYVRFLDKYQKSAADTAWIGALFQFSSQILGPIAGMLADKFGCRVIGMCGGLVMATGCVISSFATSVPYLYFSYGVITGLGASMLIASTFVIIGQYFDKRKGTAMGLATMGCGLGTFAFPPMLTGLIHWFSVGGALMIYGGLEFNNSVCAALFRPLDSKYLEKEPKELTTLSGSEGHENQEQVLDRTPTNGELIETEHNEDQTLPTTVQTSKPQSFVRRYCSMLSNVYFLLYGLEITCMSICIQCFFTYVPSLAIEHGSPDVAAALLVSIQGATETCGRILSGFLFDLPSIRHRRRIPHSALLICGGVISIVAGSMTSYWVLAILAAVFGLTMGAFHSQRATVVTEFVPPHQMATSVGFVMSFQSIGSILGTPISGFLKDHYDTFSISFFFSGSCALVAGCLFMFSQVCVRKLIACKTPNKGAED